jgi:cystathionine gamma-synthase
LVDGIRALQHVTGAMHRSLRGVPARARPQDFRLAHRRQNDNAQALAEFLAAHPKVVAVHYAGLPSTRSMSRAPPDARLRRRRLFRDRGRSRSDHPGSWMLPHPADRAVPRRRREPDRAAGADELLRADTEERLLVGIKDNLIRYSVGIEDADDLIADLAAALEQI